MPARREVGRGSVPLWGLQPCGRSEPRVLKCQKKGDGSFQAREQTEEACRITRGSKLILEEEAG